MANFFSLQDGNLTDSSVFGYSLSGEVMNNTTGVMLSNISYSYSNSCFSDGSPLSAVALHLSARSINPTGTLGLNLQRTANPAIFLDSSSNNSTVTTFGSAYQNTFSPFSPNGWSGCFNTTAGTIGLTAANTNAAAFGTLDFTVECWVYLLASNTNDCSIIDSRTVDGSTTGLTFGIQASRSLRVWTGTSNIITTTSLIPIGVWTHVAAVRSGTNLSLYINGLSSAGVTNSTNFSDSVLKIGYGVWASSGLIGLMSNLRLIKGTALYTSNFTPSASRLTAITNTSLLTLQDNRFKDNSINNINIYSVNGNTTIRDTSPFTPVKMNPSIHGGTGSFGGVNTYLTLAPNHPNFQFGTGDFTIECWYYAISSNTYPTAFEIGSHSAAGGLGCFFQKNSTLTPMVYMANGEVALTTIPSFVLNVWNHFVFQRSSGNVKIFVNGVGSGTVSNTTNIVGTNISIGYAAGQNGGVGYYPIGYISNFRVLKGTALYTTNFTPSTSPLDNISGTVLLLNTNNYGSQSYATETYAISGFTSYDGSNNLLTPYPQNWQILKLTNPLSTNRGDVLNYTLSTSSPNQLSLMGTAAITATDVVGGASPLTGLTTVPKLTSISPFSDYSYAFNGSSDTYILPENPILAFGTNDFTIEGWIYPTTTVGARMIYATRTTNTDGAANIFSWYYNSAGQLAVWTSGADKMTATTVTITANTWQHVALVRYNSLTRIYLNGVACCSGVLTNNYNVGKAGIGADSLGYEYFQGALNGYRVVNGTAVYTTPSFTVPTTPLSAIPNTVFLMKNGTKYDQALIADLKGITTSYLLSSVGGPVTLSSASPFGVGVDGSMMLSGTGASGSVSNYILLSGLNPSEFATTDFTMEGWFYFKSLTYQPLIDYNDDAGDGRGLSLTTENTENSVHLYVDTTGGTPWEYNLATSYVPTINTWTHIAAVRHNGYLYVYINGVSYGTPLNIGNTAIYTNTNTKFKFGYYSPVVNRTFNGFMSNMRVAKRALYIANFTPSNKPLTPSSLDIVLTYPYSLPYIASIVSKVDDIHISSSLIGLNTESRTITADSIVVPNLYIHNKGTLTFPLTSGKTLSMYGSAGLQITSDGTLNVGTSSAVIPLSTTHTIILSNTQIDAHNGSNLNVYGYPKLFTTNLVNDTVSGSRTFTTTDSVSGIWNIGDILTFKPNLTSRTSFDTLTLSSFTGLNTFTTTSASLFTHTGSATYANIAGVYNLNRNVIIQGINSTNRGTVRTIDAANTFINYAQLSNFGTSNSNKNGLLIANNLSGATTLSANSFLNDTNNNNNILFGSDSNTSVYFNNVGSTDYILVSGSNTMDFSSSDFTIEGWYHPNGNYDASTGNYYTVINKSIPTQWGAFLISRNVGQLLFLGSKAGTTWDYNNQSFGTLNLNSWNHFAASRSGTNLRLFLNGVLGTTVNIGTDVLFYQNTVPISIGAQNNGIDKNNCYISNIRIIKGTGAGIYTSNFIPSNTPLTNVTNTVLLTLQNNNTFKDNSTNNYTISSIGKPIISKVFSPTPTLKNITINNNIFYKTSSAGACNVINSTTSNTTINNNYILSSAGIGLQISNSTGSINMSNNTTIGSLSYGTYLFNNTLTGTYGANNFNSILQGMMVSGSNTGTIIGNGLNSAKEGVYVDASTGSLSGATFQNISANNNSSVGFKVSGNNLNYLTPVTLNINGLVANTNLDAGFEGYNITGNLSSIVANNNNLNGIKTSIGNGSTVFDGVSSTISTPISTIPLTINGTQLSSVAPIGYDASIKFNGTSDYLAPSVAYVPSTGPFTLEAWIYTGSTATQCIYSQYLATDGNRWHFSIDNNTGYKLTIAHGTASSVWGSTVVPLNSWNHVALTRDSSNTVRIYLNGALDGSSSNYTATLYALSPRIGNFSNNTIYFNGYISNLRIINGIALYTTSTITIPNTPLTRYGNSVILNPTYYQQSSLLASPPISLCNTTALNILSGYNYSQTVIKNSFLSATSVDPALSAAVALSLDSTRFSKFSLENSILSAATPLRLNVTRNLLEGSYLINNSYLGSTPLGTGIVNKYQPYTSKSTGFAFTKFNKIAGYNVTYYAHGERAIDNSIANNVLEYPTERLTPYSKTTKIRSGSKFVALDAGDNTIVRVSVRKSISTGGEIPYNGNPPRLILKSNPSVGVYADTVLDQLTLTNDVSGSFVQLTGSTQAIIYDGVLEFYIDCDGSQGWINIDNWEAS